MATYGIDVSHFQAGLSLAEAKKAGARFVVAKASEGATFKDPEFKNFRSAAKDQELLFAAYHFLRSDSSPATQAANAVAAVGDSTIPVFIDCEASGVSRPGLNHAQRFAEELRKRGFHAPVLYLPHWYWEQVGHPRLAGWTLWASDYGTNPRGHFNALYPGDSSSRWDTYGGVVPAYLQFGSNGTIPTFKGKVDVNAYRGSLQSLKGEGAFKDFTTKADPPPPPNPDPTQGQHVLDARRHIRRAIWALNDGIAAGGHVHEKQAAKGLAERALEVLDF